MPESNPLVILISHDRWATGRLLDACTSLSPEQFHRPFEIGCGSLHNTLTHMIAAMRAWTDSLANIEPRPRIDADGQRRTPDELRSLLGDASEAIAAEATRQPLSEMVTRRLRDGTTVTLTRAAVLTHVATHGMHHRAQCLNMLRQLDVRPLPLSSVAEWTFNCEPPA